GDAAAGAATVFDDHRLAERFAERDIDQPRRNVGAAAGREAYDQRDLPVRVVGARNVRDNEGCNHRQHDPHRSAGRRGTSKTAHASPRTGVADALRRGRVAKDYALCSFAMPTAAEPTTALHLI